jgi:hypothetical protein
MRRGMPSAGVAAWVLVAGQARAAHPEPLAPAPAAVPLNAAAPLHDPSIDSHGACQAPWLTTTSDQAALDAAESLCGKLLFPVAAQASTPGLLFVGGAFGTKASKFAIAPSVGVSGGAAFPVIRPSLGYYLEAPDGGTSATPVVKFRPSSIGQFYVNWLLSANVAVAGFIYPGTSSADGASPTTDLGWSIGAYTGLEFGTVTFATGGATKSQVAGTVGLIVGYLGASSVVGDAFIVGVQPGFVLHFQ